MSTDPMHALLIHQTFASPNDAGGTRHYELGKRFVSAGHQLTIVASDVSYLKGQKLPGAKHEEFDGVQVRRAWTLNKLHKSFAWRIVAFMSFMVSSVWEGLKVRNVDVVMGTSPPIFQGLSAWIVSVLKWKPFVLEIRDLWPEFAIDIGVLKSPTLIWLSRRLELFLYRRATHMVVNSPAYRTYLIEKGVEPGRISFIANGVDPQMFHIAEETGDLRRELQLEGKFVVTYAGALGMANDIDTVVDAASLLRSEERVHFLIVGDGMRRPHLEQRAGELGLTNITFLGARPKSEMPRILSLSDACLATLKNIPMFRTVYPNKVFDYMAAAKPIILGMDGVIREVVEAAVGGVVVEPGDAQQIADAVRRLSGDIEEGRTMGESGRSYVRTHFNREQHAGQFREVMEQMASPTLRRAA